MAFFRPINESPILRGLGNWLKTTGAVPNEVEIQRIVEETIVEKQRRPDEMLTGIGPAYYQTKEYPASWHKMIQTQARNLHMRHPLAKKAIRLRRSFVCGEGFKAHSKTGNPKVQEFLDRHESINWNEKTTDDRVESVSVFGEGAYWTPPQNSVNGHYELGMVQRDFIEEIVGSPLNAERPETLRLNQEIATWVCGKKIMRREFPIYRYCWLRRKWVGEVLYLGVNTTDDFHRGLTDLLPVIDWLKLFDQTMWTEGERIKFLKAFLFQYKMNGLDPDDRKITDKAKQLRQNPPGSAFWEVTNGEVEIVTVAPELNTAPVLDYLKFLQGLICGCLDMPEHFYYEANTVSKASAGEMKAPVFASVRDRKKEIASLRAAEAQIAVQKAAEVPMSLVYGLPRQELEIEIRSLNPEKEAFKVIGEHLESFARVLIATEGNYIDNKQAGELFRQAASAMGLGELKAPELNEMKSEAFEQLERRRPMLEEQFGSHPRALLGKDGKTNPDWSISGYPVAI